MFDYGALQNMQSGTYCIKEVYFSAELPEPKKSGGRAAALQSAD